MNVHLIRKKKGSRRAIIERGTYELSRKDELVFSGNTLATNTGVNNEYRTCKRKVIIDICRRNEYSVVEKEKQLEYFIVGVCANYAS